MNKAELVTALAERLGGNKKAAADTLDTVIDAIYRGVAKGDKVGITGFGVFEKVERKARTARNPKTGASVRVKKSTVPKFRPGTEFKAVVAGKKKLPKLPTAPKATPTKKAATAPVKKATAAKTATATKVATAKTATAKKATAAKTSPVARTTAAKTAGAVKKTTAKTTTAAKTGAAAKTTAAKTGAAKKTTAAKTTSAVKTGTAKTATANRATPARKATPRKAAAKR